MAQRWIKQQLTEKFLQLSATIPGLEKVKDKVYILNETVKYVKQLERRVKELEEKSNHANDDDDGGTMANRETNSAIPEVEVEARISEKQMLIKILCHKQKSSMLKIQDELKNLELSIISKSVMPFGDTTLDITIIAQIDGEYSVTTKDVVKRLSIALVNKPEIDKINGYVSVWTA